MRRRLPLRWWPLLLVALVAACNDDKPASTGGTGGAGGSGGSGGGGAVADSGSNPDTGTPTPDAGGTTDVTTPPPGDGGLVPCIFDKPTDLDRPPSGQLPCDLLPPGFVAP